jgi:hypothetical protein
VTKSLDGDPRGASLGRAMKMNTFFNKTPRKTVPGWFFGWFVVLIAGGCGDESKSSESPTHYEFRSRFDGSSSSVAYAGQTARHIIIADLTAYLGRLDAAIRSASFETVPFFDPDTLVVSCEDDLVAALNRYFRAGVGEVPWLDAEPMLITTDPPRLTSQVTYADVSSAKNLYDKLAGNDASTDAVSWNVSLATTVAFDLGDGPVFASSPTQFVDLMLAKIAQLACDAIVNGPTEAPFFVDENGIDLQQLLQKFLLGAVAYAQGADDYLDDDIAGKGILAPNTRDGDAPYTTLEHQWDEGFGYYGASRFTLTMDIANIAGSGHEDSDEDGHIDLLTEKSYGASTNAAKRDRGACVSTSFSERGMRAFIAGRHLIANAGETLTDDELAELKTHRDEALLVWEEALAASAVHYVNECLVDLAALRAEDGSYALPTHGKHWSELVGFLMSLQFNPHSQWLVRGVGPDSGPTIAFFELLELAGAAPRTDDAAEDDLVALRDALAEAYGFAPENVEGDGADCEGW